MKNQTYKYAVITNIIIVCIVFLFTFPGIAGTAKTKSFSYNETTPTTQYTSDETAETTPKINPTTIKLNKYSVALFVKNQYKIKPTVTNPSGSVQYTTKNSKIATVSSNGVVTANKAGTTTITVKNNSVAAKLKVKVKNPYFTKSGKTIKKITVCRNKATSVRINCGTIKSIKYKNAKSAGITSRTGNVINIKGKKVTSKNKPADISVTVNGVKIHLKVKVVAKTKYQKYVNISYKLKKSKISRIYLNTIKIKGLYSVKTNLEKLLASKQITKAQYNKYKKTAAKVSYTVSNTKILKLNRKNATVKCKGKGTAYITAKFNDGTKLKIKVKVTKPKTKKIYVPGTKRKVTSILCYNYEEIYKTLKSAFYEHIIKGEKPKYEYITCAFGKTKDNKLLKELKNRAKRDRTDGYNFYNYLIEPSSELIMGWNLYDNNTTIFIGISFDTELYFEGCNDADDEYRERLKAYKKYYSIAQNIFKKTNITSFKKDYQKITVLAVWMQKNYEISYDDSKKNQSLSLYNILIYKGGVCGNFSNATDYFLTLLHIPSYYVDGGTKKEINHAWNVIMIQGKWYYTDIMWYELFRGRDYINTLKYHLVWKINCELKENNIEKKDFSNSINSDFTKAIFDDNLTYTVDYFNKTFEW